jgi:hypothetical protein
MAGLRAWSTQRVVRLTSVFVRTMSARRRDWGEAVLAELAAVPPAERRLGWALGTLWFVIRDGRAEPRLTPGMRWTTRLCCALGILAVLPWLYDSIQGLRDDAPDGTIRSMVVMLVAQLGVVLAFLAAWSRLRVAPWLLIAAIAGYAAAGAFAAALDFGDTDLAALIIPEIQAMPAGPLLVLAWSAPRSR